MAVLILINFMAVLVQINLPLTASQIQQITNVTAFVISKPVQISLWLDILVQSWLILPFKHQMVSAL
jgi:hypothetical protein